MNTGLTSSILTEKEIDPAAYFKIARDNRSGAFLLFSGEVRNNNEGKDVIYLDYEAHTALAEKSIKQILSDAVKKWELHQALCVHRVGRVELSGCAIVVLTASAHRGECYAANRYIVDRVKYEAPIWKREFYVDGTSHWGRNCEHEHGHEHVENDRSPHKHAH